jgi:uncharacterized repeat protein (TIGR01451 family)
MLLDSRSSRTYIQPIIDFEIILSKKIYRGVVFMRALVSGVALLALAAIGNAAVTDAVHAQPAPTPPGFTKQALDANGAPLTGPVSVGQTIRYVLSYNSGTSPLGAVTIKDTLSSNLAYVNQSIVAPPGSTWTLAGYSPGNQETYSNSGFGPGTSFIMNVPVAQLGQSGSSAGDGFYPIPVGNKIWAVFHHEIYGAAKINCWDLLSLVQCPGTPAYPRSLDSSGDLRTTPQTVRTVVAGPASAPRIYYPSARYNSTTNITAFGIGCWDTAAETPCAFIPLPTNPSLSGKYEGNTAVAGTALYSIIAGIVAEPSNPNRLFMYAIDKVYCVDVSVPNAPVPCSSWSPPTLGGGGSQWLDIMVGENAPASPTKIYVHYGTTGTNNKTTVACLNASDGTRCGTPWPATDPQATSTTGTSRYGMLSPMFAAGVMNAVCLHPYVNGPAGDAAICFHADNGSVVPGSANFVSAVGNLKIITAFHMPNPPNTFRVLYARYQNNPPVSCFDFAADASCSPFTPGWGPAATPVNAFEDYGYAVDNAAPDRCVLGLGNQGIIWRFARDGSFDTKGCVKRVEATFDVNSFFCAVKPTKATWNSIVFLNPPPASQLTGGTINVTIGSTPLPAISYTPGTNTYLLNGTAGISALGANSQATVLFTPQYGSIPTAGYQLQLTFTADVDPQICYKATVAACGPVSNNATMAGSIIGPAAPVPFTATAGVNLGNATGGSCEPGLLKVCKVAGPGIAIGTPFTFTAGSGKFSVPAGPAPGGTCMIGPTFPVGSNVTVDEDVPPGYSVSSIAVAPPKQLVGTPNLAAGSVNVTIGTGVTVVTFVDKLTGFLEICKKGDVTGNFSFTVSPGGLGPFVVPAGACSPPIEVIAGPVVITELPTSGITLVGCSTYQVGQQGLCDPNAQTSTVTVAAGDVSTETIAFITNRRK